MCWLSLIRELDLLAKHSEKFCCWKPWLCLECWRGTGITTTWPPPSKLAAWNFSAADIDNPKMTFQALEVLLRNVDSLELKKLVPPSHREQMSEAIYLMVTNGNMFVKTKRFCCLPKFVDLFCFTAGIEVRSWCSFCSDNLKKHSLSFNPCSWNSQSLMRSWTHEDPYHLSVGKSVANRSLSDF